MAGHCFAPRRGAVAGLTGTESEESMPKRRLAKSMRLRDPSTGQLATFLAGTVPPDWAQEAITNPVAWGEVVDEAPPAKPEPEPEKKAPAKKAAAKKAPAKRTRKKT